MGLYSFFVPPVKFCILRVLSILELLLKVKTTILVHFYVCDGGNLSTYYVFQKPSQPSWGGEYSRNKNVLVGVYLESLYPILALQESCWHFSRNWERSWTGPDLNPADSSPGTRRLFSNSTWRSPFWWFWLRGLGSAGGLYEGSPPGHQEVQLARLRHAPHRSSHKSTLLLINANMRGVTKFFCAFYI